MEAAPTTPPGACCGGTSACTTAPPPAAELPPLPLGYVQITPRHRVPEVLLEHRKVEHNCGVYGVFSQRENASRVVFFALYALNHRGQESAGIASYGLSGVHVHKGMGLVSQVFSEEDITGLAGMHAIGHTRYSTKGGSQLAGAQPFVLETDLGQLALAHNGQVARTSALRKLVLKRGVGLFTNSDSEIIAQMLARPHSAADALAFSEHQPLGIDVASNRPLERAEGGSGGGGQAEGAAGGASGGGGGASGGGGGGGGGLFSGTGRSRSHSEHAALAAEEAEAAAAASHYYTGSSASSADSSTLSAAQQLDESGSESPSPSRSALPGAGTPPPALPPRAPAWAMWVSRMAAFMRDCEGAYSLVVLTKDAVYGIRDPYGLRPLCLGRQLLPDGKTYAYHLSSESCALATVGATYLREVRPGEIVRLDKKGMRSWRPLACPPAAPGAAGAAAAAAAAAQLALSSSSSGSGSGRPPLPPASPTSSTSPPLPASPPRATFCVFEYVYFARPDSRLEGRHVHSVRSRLGVQLALESPPGGDLRVDLVSGVPDSSVAAAIGYANALRLPFSEVFCKNRYIGRTFIKPDDTLRKNAIQLKYNPLVDVLAGKSIVLVDDSLVRGNTLRQLVPLLRGAGAREVHVRISSPPIRHPCYYGVDIGSYEELIATHIATVEGLRDYIGADSLAYLSYEGMLRAVEGADAEGAPGHCTGCFNGVYPIAHDK